MINKDKMRKPNDSHWHKLEALDKILLCGLDVVQRPVSNSQIAVDQSERVSRGCGAGVDRTLAEGLQGSVVRLCWRCELML